MRNYYAGQQAPRTGELDSLCALEQIQAQPFSDNEKADFIWSLDSSLLSTADLLDNFD